MAELKVLKTTGKIEDFQSTKIINGILKAGGTPQEAEDISHKITDWIVQRKSSEPTKTTEIKEKVLQLLKEVNPKAGETFKSYRKVPVQTN